MTAIRKSNVGSGGRGQAEDLRVGDIVRYLSYMADLQRDERTGNPGVAGALRLLVRRLTPYKSRPISDLAELRLGGSKPSARAPRKPAVELPNDLAALNCEEVNAILDDNRYQKKQIVELGALRFGIPRSKLIRQKRAEAIISVRAALDHERSLEAIKFHAQLAGERRSPG